MALQPVSAAFDPVITLLERALRTISTTDVIVLIVAQLVGGAVGAVVANVMFSSPPVTASSHARGGPGIWIAEILATMGLVMIIFSAARNGRSHQIGYLVGAYITAAYWFTSRLCPPPGW